MPLVSAIVRFFIAFLLGVFVASVARAQPAPEDFAIPTDPVLAALIAESLAARPEVRAAEDEVRARRAQARQAGALPDPTLSLGIQNDGFDRLMIGEMETSYASAMASQAFPWPGKQGLRTEVAELGTAVAEAGVARARLGIEADVRRAYVELLLVRERARLLDRLAELWAQAEAIARIRYEAGEGSQADVLRAQLERARLQQRRWSLEAEERVRVQALNRLRARPLDTTIETPTALRDLPVAEPSVGDAALREALARSPELAAARAAVDRAGQATALARKGYGPDVTVSGGIMARGALPPMWQAGVSFPLPVYAGRKQASAVAETEALAKAEREREAALVQLLGERVAERTTQWTTLRQVVDLYRKGLLVQSAATTESTLAQYQVGRASFTAVLEAIAGYVGDEDAFAQSLASLHRIAILHGEVSLEPVGLSTGSMGGTGMSASSPSGAAAPVRAAGSAPAGAAAAAPTSSMGM